jgi:putative inorganic carbon (hco3(-)) transporter
MSAMAMAWAALAALFLIASLRRPVWAVALYMLTFFAAPHFWWWGADLPTLRYSLISGFVLLVAVAFHSGQAPVDTSRRFTLVHAAAVAAALNAGLVHAILASDPATSFADLLEVLKFTLLIFLLAAAMQTKRDFRLVLIAIALGAAYIGYEVTINERGYFRGGRLEGVGAPGADSSNSLANVMLMTLPLIGSLFVGGSRRDKLIVVCSAPLALNVLLLCNSRGAFIGLIASGVVFLLIARGITRKHALRALGLGGLALFLLLGDPQILERFSSTFLGSEDRDRSAASRIEFWRAGVNMIRDYPLGAGGGAFKYVHGAEYLAEITGEEVDRSLHNGFLTEATSWGVQGLLLRLVLFGAAIFAALRTSNRCRLHGRAEDAMIGLCVVATAMGFLVHNMFGVFLTNEWSYWIIALLVSYHQLYEPGRVALGTLTAPAAAASGAPQAAA